MRVIRALIFDLDGVITETSKFHYQAWRDEVKKYGIDYTSQQNDSLKGLSRVKTLDAIIKLHHKDAEISSEKRVEIATLKNERYKKLLTKLDQSHVLPNILKILDDAKKRELKLAIASSSYNAPAILKALKLTHYFDFIVSPADVKNGKPAPDIFLLACQGVNTPSIEAVGFEDAIAGVNGLHDAGLFVVAITYGVKENWENAHLQYKTTDELNLDIILEKAIQ